MDQELIAYFDEHFREARRYTESLHEQTTQQIADLRQETTEQIRHTQVLVEGMHDKIQLLAEGYFGLEERLKAFQNQTAKDFKSVHSVLNVHYKDFDDRLQIVEKRTERQGRDPLDILREQYGKGETV